MSAMISAIMSAIHNDVIYVCNRDYSMGDVFTIGSVLISSRTTSAMSFSSASA